MYFLFSGEGPTDLGLCANKANACDGQAYNHGPMTIIVDQIVEEEHGYSFLAGTHYGYVSKRMLVERASRIEDNQEGDPDSRQEAAGRNPLLFQ